MHLHSFIARQFPEKIYMVTFPLEKMRDLMQAGVDPDSFQILRDTPQQESWIDMTAKDWEGSIVLSYKNNEGEEEHQQIAQSWYAMNLTSYSCMDDADDPVVAIKQPALAEYTELHPYS